MNTFVKINSINYPADIFGHVRDRDWDNRESKVIVLALTIQEALDLFVDGLQWSIVYGTQTIPQDEFIIAGPITDNRNGTVSVRMGKPTAAEVSSIITGGAVDLPTAYTMRAVIEDSVAALYNEWTDGSYKVGDIRLAWYGGTHQPWKCRQEHDTTTYPDITPDGSAWRTFWIPFHGTTPEAAQAWVAPSGAHDQYEAGEYMVYTDGNTYKCLSATVYTPDEYSQAWEAV